MKCNYHTHSLYCDGKEELEQYVLRGINENFNHLGFSSHAPIAKENNFGIRKDKIGEYCREIDHLNHQYIDIQLYKGLEYDYIPSHSTEFSLLKSEYQLDYIIGGIHLVEHPESHELWFIDGHERSVYDNGIIQIFNNDIQKAVTTFWEQTFAMIETQSFDIIAHLDKIKMHNQNRYFTESEKWYIDLVDHAIELIKEKGIIIEINSRGIYKGRCTTFYPSDYIIEEASKRRIPFVISSDAHKSEELSLLYQEAREKLREYGIKEQAVKEGEGWKMMDL